MANRSLHFCNQPGCRVLTSERYCIVHASLHEQREDNRPGAAERGYDGRWHKLRDAYLRRHPLCELCERKGMVTVANVVHHVKPIDEGGAKARRPNVKISNKHSWVDDL